MNFKDDKLKKYLKQDVFTAAKQRISFVFDNFESIYLSFSGGKDSTVMFHLVAEEAARRKRKIGVLLIDFEAQYKATVRHSEKMFKRYKKNIEPYWTCLPIKLRNAVSNFEPVWCCWEPEKKDFWVRDFPEFNVVKDCSFYPFFQPKMEFEEFIVLFGEWFKREHNNKNTACFVGIRADESLNRFRTIASFKKKTFKKKRYTTQVLPGLYNIYPIYDWKVQDIWKYHSVFPDKEFNEVYELMHKAGVPLGDQRLCQPYGDDQRKGLWLYHILEPQSWYKVVARVNGANYGALYVQESGNVLGNDKIIKPEGHTYKSFCNLLLNTLPSVSRENYLKRFKVFIKGWKARGYSEDIPDEAPRVLENKHWAPSYRRLCKVLLRNDWWCKGLGLQQPKSEAYGKYLKIRNEKRRKNKVEK